MSPGPSRRSILVGAGCLPVWLAACRPAAAVAPQSAVAGDALAQDADLPFRISLAQWSLHRTLFSGKLDPLDFPAVAKQRFGLEAVEYVNAFFKDKATDFAWLGELRRRAADAGVRSLLIMIDGEGALGALDDQARRTAIEKHMRWIAAASFLGCHSIRVNAAGDGTAEQQRDHAADSLRRLATWGEDYGISVIVENHGGRSSDGGWLASVMRQAGHDGVGTLPDFGNFHLGDGKWYDRYRGVAELMPFAKAVSAKSHDFDDTTGQETSTDYRKMLGIVAEAGYRGWIGIEYEGSRLSEDAGILATKALLEKVRARMGG